MLIDGSGLFKLIIILEYLLYCPHFYIIIYLINTQD